MTRHRLPEVHCSALSHKALWVLAKQAVGIAAFSKRRQPVCESGKCLPWDCYEHPGTAEGIGAVCR